MTMKNVLADYYFKKINECEMKVKEHSLDGDNKLVDYYMNEALNYQKAHRDILYRVNN